MLTIKCLIRERDGLCHPGTIEVDGTDKDDGLLLSDSSACLRRVGTTKVMGWGKLDDDNAVEFEASESGWCALVKPSILSRLGL